jgi:hypothetical protein
MFEPFHQTLCQIEVYFPFNYKAQRKISYTLQKELPLSNCKVPFQMINKVIGPTFPPLVAGELAVLMYEGVSFTFKYTEPL